MAGDGGLADVQPLDDVIDGAFALPEFLQDAPAVGFGEDFERGDHARYMTVCVYTCQRMKTGRPPLSQ